MATATHPQAQATTAGRVMSILGFVFAAVALFLFPILFGPIAMVCSGIGVGLHDRLGKPALITSILCTIGGFVLGALVFAASN